MKLKAYGVFVALFVTAAVLLVFYSHKAEMEILGTEERVMTISDYREQLEDIRSISMAKSNEEWAASFDESLPLAVSEAEEEYYRAVREYLQAVHEDSLRRERIAEQQRQEQARQAQEAQRRQQAASQQEPASNAPAAPPRAGGSVWDALAQCESGGNWSINTGNGFFGGLQFSLQSWRGVGGTGYPHQHSRAEQILRAERLLAIQGWGAAWPGCSRQLGLR